MSIKKRYYHIMQGFNYRMTNLQAAIGCSQIDEIKKILKKRLNQQNYYYKKLKEIKEIKIRKFTNWCQPVHWLITITLNKKNVRDRLIKFLNKKGIDARQMVNPVSDALYLKKKFNKKNYPVSYETSRNSLHLPSSITLKKNEIDFICNEINFFFIKK